MVTIFVSRIPQGLPHGPVSRIIKQGIETVAQVRNIWVHPKKGYAFVDLYCESSIDIVLTLNKIIEVNRVPLKLQRSTATSVSGRQPEAKKQPERNRNRNVQRQDLSFRSSSVGHLTYTEYQRQQPDKERGNLQVAVPTKQLTQRGPWKKIETQPYAYSPKRNKPRRTCFALCRKKNYHQIISKCPSIKTGVKRQHGKRKEHERVHGGSSTDRILSQDTLLLSKTQQIHSKSFLESIESFPSQQQLHHRHVRAHLYHNSKYLFNIDVDNRNAFESIQTAICRKHVAPVGSLLLFYNGKMLNKAVPPTICDDGNIHLTVKGIGGMNQDGSQKPKNGFLKRNQVRQSDEEDGVSSSSPNGAVVFDHLHLKTTDPDNEKNTLGEESLQRKHRKFGYNGHGAAHRSLNRPPISVEKYTLTEEVLQAQDYLSNHSPNYWELVRREVLSTQSKHPGADDVFIGHSSRNGLLNIANQSHKVKDSAHRLLNLSAPSVVDSDSGYISPEPPRLRSVEPDIQSKDNSNIIYKLSMKHDVPETAVIPVIDCKDNKHKFIVYSDACNWEIHQIDFGHDTIIKNPKVVSSEAIDVMKECQSQNCYITAERKSRLHHCIRTHAEALFSVHSNQNIISTSAIKSKGGEMMKDSPCIVLYCTSKGYIPVGEKNYPKTISMEDQLVDIDVREGHFQFGYLPKASNFRHDKVRMGCEFGAENGQFTGTIGPFVDLQGELAFLTCAHVIYGIDLNGYDKHNVHRFIEQPGSQCHLDQTKNRCGQVSRAVFSPNSQPSSIDAAVVIITDQERAPCYGEFAIAKEWQYKLAGFDDIPSFNSGRIHDKPETIDNDVRIVKFGAETHVTRGVISCYGTVVRSLTLEMDLPGHQQKVTMYNQLEIIGNQPPAVFSQPGDSGSAVFYVDKSSGKQELVCIGMVIGCTSYGNGIVTPIADILNALNLTPGTLKSFP